MAGKHFVLFTPCRYSFREKEEKKEKDCVVDLFELIGGKIICERWHKARLKKSAKK